MFMADMEALLTKVKNRYELVTLAAKRTRALSEGAKPLVEIISKNPIDIALAEIAVGKIRASSLPGDPSRSAQKEK